MGGGKGASRRGGAPEAEGVEKLKSTPGVFAARKTGPKTQVCSQKVNGKEQEKKSVLPQLHQSARKLVKLVKRLWKGKTFGRVQLNTSGKLPGCTPELKRSSKGTTGLGKKKRAGIGVKKSLSKKKPGFHQKTKINIHWGKESNQLKIGRRRGCLLKNCDRDQMGVTGSNGDRGLTRGLGNRPRLKG